VSALAGLSIVLVCSNEEANVGHAIGHAVTAAGRATDEYEVIVVDDGSADGSLQVASEAARRDRRVRLLVHAGVRGYGAAVRTGIDAARMPWILLADAGPSVDPRELQRLLPHAAGADLLIGRPPPSGSFARRLAMGALDVLARRAPGVSAHDADSALKLARRDLVDRLPLSSDGRGIGTELVVRALAAGARVSEVEVRRSRGLPDSAAGARGGTADGGARAASVADDVR
jgi:glycosyltransferase involved in cell wall biosynthesis